jgi:hypothetical protein
MRRIAVMLTAGVLGLTGLVACGGDDDDDAGGGGGDDVSEAEQPYVDAMIENFRSGDADELTLTDEQAECVGPKWIDTIGVERLEEAGLEPSDIASDSESDISELGLSEDEGGELYDAFGACDVDLQALFIDSLAADEDLTDEDRQCLVDNFDEDFLRRILVLTLTQGDDALEGDEELTGELFDVFSECPGAVN